MSEKRLVKTFRRWRKHDVPLVLGTVVETEGSTYSKPGHRVLIAGDGRFQGLVTGGCLEGDLAEHARQVLGTHEARVVTYDLRGPDEEVFGLGVGCDGMFRILLQPLGRPDNFEPLSSIAACLLGHEHAAVAVVVDSNSAELHVGATLVEGGSGSGRWQVPDRFRDIIRRHCLTAVEQTRSSIHVHDDPDCRFKLLCTPLRPIPRLLILGAGLDAVPVLELADRLGWRVTILDHRAANLERGDFRGAERTKKIDPARLAAQVKLARFDAAVLMTHHLATDRTCLGQLADSPIRYVGLLGPIGRRDRLLADIGARAALLQGRLHAPAGLSVGADSPESIALSIVAELQAVFARRNRPDGQDRA